MSWYSLLIEKKQELTIPRSQILRQCLVDTLRITPSLISDGTFLAGWGHDTTKENIRRHLSWQQLKVGQRFGPEKDE